MTILFGLLLGSHPAYTQYSISTNGNYDPVFDFPTDIIIGQDDISLPIDIGFNFDFFGNTYSQFTISSNGFMTFQNPGVSGTDVQSIPDPTNPNDLIALGWASFLADDLEFSYEVIGIAPNRTLHVNYWIYDYDEPPSCPFGFYLDGQVILYESTNIIELHTWNWDGGDCGIPATQGLENADGSIAFYVNGRNNSLWTTYSSMVRFLPETYIDLEVISMDPVLCDGLMDVSILVKNVGGGAVDTFYADWTWDGVPQDSVNVYTSLPPNGVTEVILGQKTIDSGTNYMLKAWTYNPENQPDDYVLNDTISGTVKGGLSGTYTIGGTSPNYATIADAITALVTYGACDTVIFDIRSGTYTEELDIPNITVASGAVVIFQSETNNANDVTITRHYTSGSSNRMLEINNASHLHFKDLTLKITGTSCASVVYINSYCADIQFTGCIIIGNTCNSTTTSGAVIALFNGQKDDIVLDSNIIRKGSHGVYVSPGFSSYANDLVLTNNTIDSFYRYGAYLNRTQGLNLTGNTINAVSAAAYGIETNTTYGPTLLDQNSIYVPFGVYGLRVYRYNYNTSSFTDTMYVVNNMINIGGAVSGSRGLSVEQSSKVNVWHNTIHTTSTSNTSYAFYSTSNALTDLRNSIVTNFGAGRAAWLNTITCDHNAYFNLTGPLIGNVTDYALLEDWVQASGQDQNSLQVDPEYVSTTDLHVGQGALNNAGDALAPAVTEDFDQESRNVSTPDIGADEFGFLNDDLSISALVFSEDLLNGPNEIAAVVYNIGLNPVDSFIVHWRLNGDDLTDVMVNTTIPVGGGDTIILGIIDLQPNQAYNFSVNTHLPNGNADNDMSNDTLLLGPVYARLNGLYTVGGVDPDFGTLSAAFTAINNGGMLDSVAFAVREGFYQDPIELISQSAYSCNKPVRVYSETGNAADVVFTNNNQVKPTIRLNGVSGISFSNMTFELTASAFHNVVIIENGAACNKFYNCKFTGKITTQTSAAYATVLCNSNQGVDNDFYGNTFSLGSVGLSTNGPNLTTGSLVDIIGNTFTNNYSQGLSVANSRFVKVIGNEAYLTTAQHSGYTGMFVSGSQSMILSHNSVFNPFISSGRGLGYTECAGTASNTTKVYNNYVYGGTANGLQAIFGGSYSNYVHVANNTSRTHLGRAAGFSWSSNFLLDNNIFECIGAGLTLELLNMGSSIVSENNCLYAPNGSIGELNNAIYNTMAQWQVLGYDVTSRNINPLFDDLTFRPHAVLLDGVAIPYAHIQDDHEGDMRNPTTPDIGADEFDPLTADAGLLDIIHPKMPFPTGTNPVYVRFYNNSGDTLETLQFDWEVNGSLQPSFIWNGILTRGAIYDSLEIGQFTFDAQTPYQIKVWVSEPNSMPDQLAINDTIEVVNQYAGLAGVYTIGGVDPDFETITDAVNALNAGGASAAVTFNIRNGTYLETILLNDFPGSECDRPVIFQSESGDSSLVTITNLGINAHTIVLNGADGVQFKNMTLKSVNTSFRHVVLFSGGAHCNLFEGNNFKGFQSTAIANTSAVIRSTAGLDTANVFIHNRIMDGSFSLHLVGNGGGITNTVISGNHMEPYYRGIYNSALQGVTISHNTIIADNDTNGAGLEILTGHNLKEISYNTILAPIGAYGIDMNNCDNTINNRGRIYNNFISVGGSGTAIGIYLTGGCTYQDILHNSVLVYSTHATLNNTAPIYLTSNANLRILNNAFKNDGLGYAVYANSNTSFISDNNAYHTDGSTFGYWNGGAVETTFANWQAACLQDTNSINVDPNFMSTTDLHTFLVLLNEAGDPNTGVLFDIDGEPRDSLPDIGADEFDPLPNNDAGIFMFAGPHIPFAADTLPVNLVLKNFGGNALSSVTVRWAVNGIEQAPYEWTGNLPSAVCDTFQVGSYTFEELIAYNIDAWTEMPNDTSDADPDNDLLSTGTFYASLAGIYTVGGFAPDFNLVSELETILNIAGIVDHVTFEFRPGEYQEALVLTDFPKSSYEFGVTFTSETSDSSDVILTQIANSTVLVDLDDAHKITFSHMTLTNTKGHIFQIRNGSSQITITNNRIESQESLSSGRSLIYSSTTTEDSISILNNHFHNGYYGIFLYGGDYEKRHIITGNTFTGKYHISLYLRRFDGLTCSNNLFQATSTGNLDFYMYDGRNACTITNNSIYSDLSSGALYIGSFTNTSPTSSLFANNFIYKPGTASNHAAVIENVAKINIDFNSIYNDRNHASSAALYTNSLSTHNIRNNIFYSIKGPAYHNNGTLPAIHNYNAIFSLGPVTAIQNSTNYPSLAAYASGTSTNANSKGVDPLFISTEGPEISQYQLNNTGLTIPGLTTDINGTTRTSPPDIGALEFTPPTFDVKTSHVISPTFGCGLSDEETVQVVLVNMGSMVATGFDIFYEFNDQTIEENIGALQVPPGDSLIYTFTETIDVSAFGDYTLLSWIDFPADVNSTNDTTTHGIENLPPLSTPPGNLIPTDGTMGLENQVSLSWSPVNNAVNYDLYVWATTGSKPVIPTHAGLTTINKLVTGLVYGTTYLWQVHAVNACDEELASDTSAFATRFLPDLVVDSIVIPANAFSEQTIAVEWVVKNQGLGSTIPGTWYDNIYLSADPTYNNFDPLLGSISNLTSLNADQSYSHFANVVLPQGTNGLYYIIVKTDHYNSIKETNDPNNTSYSATQINVTLSPPPDLIPINISTPGITFSGQSINITYEVKNIGSGITTDSIWKDEFTLVPSSGNSSGSNFSFGSRTHTGLLLPDSSYFVQHTVLIPENIFGEYQIRVFADSKNDVFEFASEGNNQALSDVFEIILTPPVDLVPDSLAVPDTMSLYETYPVTFQIRNEGGSAPTTGWTDRYYLSQSPVYNSNFLTLLGSAHHNPGLMPGESNYKTVNIKLTQNISDIYYIYLVTDFFNQINEYAMEGNNILRSDPITIIKPDIKPDSLFHAPTVMSGATLSLEGELINPGPGIFKGNHLSRFYLSDDDVLSTESDILLTTKTSSNIILTTSDTVIVPANVVIPVAEAGEKYILWHADGTGVIHESNENNNILASPITIFEAPHPDLVASNMIVPDTIRAGVPFEFAYTLTNIGDVAMNTNMVDSFFISFSPSWNRSVATPLGYRGTSLLDTAAFVVHQLQLETPFNQNPNEYYLYIITDATSKVYEGSGEANNILRSDLLYLFAYPDTDLAIHSIAGIPDTLTSGQLVPVTYMIQNLSSDPTYFGSWNERLYFSVDSIFNPLTDMPIQIFSYGGGIIEANSTIENMAMLDIPDGITGDYYLFIETDYTDLNEDIDRLNNSNTARVAGDAHRIHIKLALYPDLVPTDFVSPVGITSGQFFTITTEVSNLGLGAAHQRTDKIFVSTNNTIENGDLALVSVVRPPLQANAIQNDTFLVFIPANYSGNYYLIYAVDHGNAVYEHNDEDNNILLSSIVATPPPPADLIVQNILVPDSILAGEMGSITWQTKNQGLNPANGQFREILYLSTDTLWQLEDEVLAIWDGTVALAAGATTTKTVQVPYNRITNGDYHTIVRTDARNNILESDEDNNDAYSYDQTNIDIEEIFLDVQTEKLLPLNTYRYFKVEIPAEEANRNMLISLTGDSLLGINELYMKYGGVPTEADHDFSYSTPFSPHQQIIARNLTPGYYYIMVKGFMIEGSGPQTISLLARIIYMEILSMSPNRGGNAGYTTIEVVGSELDSIIQVKLVLDDSTGYYEIVADTFLSLDQGERIIARFNLTGQPLGHYHLQCHRESIWMASYQRGFEIIEGGGPDLQVYWDINPKSYNARFNSLFQIKIDVENRGNSDAVDRFVRVNTPDFDNPVYYSLNDYYNGIVHPQLVLASEDLNGFPGVLRPGSRRTFYVFGSVGGTQGFSISYDK